jgi:hypothetical protein
MFIRSHKSGAQKGFRVVNTEVTIISIHNFCAELSYGSVCRSQEIVGDDRTSSLIKGVSKSIESTGLNVVVQDSTVDPQGTVR